MTSPIWTQFIIIAHPSECSWGVSLTPPNGLLIQLLTVKALFLDDYSNPNLLKHDESYHYWTSPINCSMRVLLLFEFGNESMGYFYCT